MTNTPRFASVSCSQCGRDFGPGDHGYSHCDSHRKPVPPITDEDREKALLIAKSDLSRILI